MFDQMLPSLVTLTLLLCMFLWALLIDFLIHMHKRNSGPARDPRLERRKSHASAVNSIQTHLPEDASLRSAR